MLQKVVTVTPTLQKGKKLDRLAPVDTDPPGIRMGARNKCAH